MGTTSDLPNGGTLKAKKEANKDKNGMYFSAAHVYITLACWHKWWTNESYSHNYETVLCMVDIQVSYLATDAKLLCTEGQYFTFLCILVEFPLSVIISTGSYIVIYL